MEFKKYFLKDLVENFSVRAKDYGGASNLEFLGVSNEDGIVQSKYAAEEKAEDYKIIEKGCFAYNPYRINVGSIAYFAEDIKGLISPAYVIFKTKPNKINDKILLKFLKSSEGLRQIKLNARGTVRQALRFEDLCKIEISIPEYDEQELLISKIENVEIKNEYVSSELTNQLNLIKQLRQSFLREAMQGKLVSNKTKDSKTGAELLAEIQAEKEKLIKEKKIKKSKPLPPISEEEIPFEIPENWVWCRLGEISNIITSGSRDWSKYYSDNGANFVRSSEIRDNVLDLKRCIKVKLPEKIEGKRTLIQRGDLLTTITGGNVGKCAFVDSNIEESYVSQSVSLTKLTFIECVKFIYYCFLSPIGTSEDLKKSIYGIGRPVLSLPQISALKVPLPPLEIQERIVSKLDELMQFCDHLENSVKKSQKLNEQLLQQVLREALQPKTKEVVLPLVAEDREEYSKTKVVELKPTNVDYYKRSVLAAELVWQLHKEPTLGHLKLQKLIYLCQKTSEMQLPTNFLRQAMGPYDNRLMRSIDKQFLEKKWFSYNKQSSLKYLPLEKAGEHQKDFLNYFSNEQENIQFLIDKFRKAKSDSIEIVATLYACIERILEEKSIFSEGLLIKYFYEWSDEKKKFSEIEVKEKFAQMIKTGITPKGFM